MCRYRNPQFQVGKIRKGSRRASTRHLTLYIIMTTVNTVQFQYQMNGKYHLIFSGMRGAFFRTVDISVTLALSVIVWQYSAVKSLVCNNKNHWAGGDVTHDDEWLADNCPNRHQVAPLVNMSQMRNTIVMCAGLVNSVKVVLLTVI